MEEDLTNSRIEREIEQIRIALKEINPHNCSASMADSLADSQPQEGIEIEINKIPSNFSSKLPDLQQTSEQWELNILLESEREKNANLEQRLAHKDKLLEDLSALQNDLYSTIEDLQSKEAKLLKEVEKFKLKFEAAEIESFKFKETVKIRNNQIAKLNKIIEYKIGELIEEKCEKCGLKEQEIQKTLEKLQENEEVVQNYEKENWEIKQDYEELRKNFNFYQEKSFKLQEELDHANSKLVELSIKSQTHSKKSSLKIDTGNIEFRNSDIEYLASPSSEIKELQSQIRLLEEKVSRSLQSTPKTDVNGASELFRILGASNEKSAIKRVLYLESHHQKNKKYCKFYKRIIELIQRCSETALSKDISCKSAWKLLTRLLEEFMTLKKSTDLSILNKLCEIFKLKSPGELIDYAKNIQLRLEGIL
ncbi:unnamed protein product [Blepharisma stoltei]|uniref:FRIGIDA-like protein n=1 Tax=Blepharisma stoltei TaxID=1481888 RepID=A0AAU9IZ89_9CILI|nr:unnamed protein product [Blepharisma stoltei]